jgi:hypothetical protein
MHMVPVLTRSTGMLISMAHTCFYSHAHAPTLSNYYIHRSLELSAGMDTGGGFASETAMRHGEFRNETETVVT